VEVVCGQRQLVFEFAEVRLWELEPADYLAAGETALLPQCGAISRLNDLLSGISGVGVGAGRGAGADAEQKLLDFPAVAVVRMSMKPALAHVVAVGLPQSVSQEVRLRSQR
jgi:hypothetical protein